MHPEKWEPVFRKEARQDKVLGSVRDSIKTGQTVVVVNESNRKITVHDTTIEYAGVPAIVIDDVNHTNSTDSIDPAQMAFSGVRHNGIDRQKQTNEECHPHRECHGPNSTRAFGSRVVREREEARQIITWCEVKTNQSQRDGTKERQPDRRARQTNSQPQGRGQSPRVLPET